MLRTMAIPPDCWQQTHLKIRFDKKDVISKCVAYIPVCLEGFTRTVKFYQHDMEAYDCLLGVDFLQDC
ncbi:hypothetical protein KI387_035251, partial [Taxus chinensis]